MGILLDSNYSVWERRREGIRKLYDGSMYGSKAITEALYEIDQEIMDACDLINKRTYSELSSADYTSNAKKIVEIQEKAADIDLYISTVHQRIYQELESDWRDRIGRSMEILSTVSNLGQYRTDNTPGVVTYGYKMETDGPESAIAEMYVKPSIGFEDFLPMANPDVPNGYRTDIKGDFYVKAFADLYRSEFDLLLKQRQTKRDTLDGFLADILTDSQVVYKSPYSYKTFLSSVLEATAISPLIEAIRGKDAVTGFTLTQAERDAKKRSAALGLGVLVGSGIYGGVVKGLSIGEILVNSGVNITIGMAGAGTSSLSNEALVKAGVPEEIAALVANGMGIAVAWKLSKWYDGALVNKEIQSPAVEDIGKGPGRIEYTAEDLKQIEKYEKFLREGSTAGLTPEELAVLDKVDDQIALNKVNYDDILKLRKGAGEAVEPVIPPAGDQTRINIANGPTRFSPSKKAGLSHVIDRHFNKLKNAGQFTISVDELKEILGRKDVIQSPISVLPTSGQFTRVVDVGEVIGTVKPSMGGQATTWIEVITDIKGNLITTYPVPAPIQ